MAVAWPVSLQDKVNEDSFSYEVGETVLRSDMDVGPQKLRRISTRPIDKMTVSINVTVDQWQDFMTFYNTTTNGGTLRFEFNHPITQVLTEFRFASVPRTSSLGGGNFMVVMDWEVMA